MYVFLYGNIRYAYVTSRSDSVFSSCYVTFNAVISGLFRIFVAK